MKCCFDIQVEGIFYVNDPLEKLMFEELRNACRGGGDVKLYIFTHTNTPFALSHKTRAKGSELCKSD